MGNKEIAQVQLVPQVLQQLQNLGLDGDVQGGYGLVGDEEPGPLNQRRGDGHPLPLPAGELPGLCREALLRKLHPLQHLPHPPLSLLGAVLAEDTQGLLQNPGHRIGGVQGAVGVLKDHLGPFGVVEDLPLVRLHHPQDGPGQGGLAGAGLPHQAQDLTVADVEGHVVEHLLVRPPTEGAALPVAAGDMPEGEDNFLAHGRSSLPPRVGMAAMSRWV